MTSGPVELCFCSVELEGDTLEQLSFSLPSSDLGICIQFFFLVSFHLGHSLTHRIARLGHSYSIARCHGVVDDDDPDLPTWRSCRVIDITGQTRSETHDAITCTSQLSRFDAFPYPNPTRF